MLYLRMWISSKISLLADSGEHRLLKTHTLCPLFTNLFVLSRTTLGTRPSSGKNCSAIIRMVSFIILVPLLSRPVSILEATPQKTKNRGHLLGRFALTDQIFDRKKLVLQMLLSRLLSASKKDLIMCEKYEVRIEL